MQALQNEQVSFFKSILPGLETFLRMPGELILNDLDHFYCASPKEER